MDSYTEYLFTQGVLGVVAAALIVVVIYQQRKLDKKDEAHAAKIEVLNNLLLAEIKSHAADYKKVSDDYQETTQGTAQTIALLGAKIEVAKGK